MPKSTAPTPPAVIAFDLDGTLVDTAPDLLGTLDVVLEEAGAAPIARDETRKMVGAGVRALVERGLTRSGLPFDTALVDTLFTRFIDHYTAHIADHSRPFPGVIDALDKLSARGFQLAVCTNKLEALSVRLLRELDLADRFAVIAGADTFPVNKPDARHLIGTIERAGGIASRAIMVGDSATDVATARNAGVPVIVVPFGYTDVPARELGGDLLIEHFSELGQAVDTLLRAPA